MIFRPLAFLLFAAGEIALLALAPASSSQAQNASVTIDASEGYGVNSAACAAVGYDCERIIADAWCEAHGHGRSLSVERIGGRASDRFAIACE